MSYFGFIVQTKLKGYKYKINRKQREIKSTTRSE